ncbi:MAG: type pilus assembly protein PilA [Actinomycetota bacterium]|jgi:type IV pilus assembly protein PilA|nr:type pilus assembly protein PilA [Actinomycetota bacterium]
MPAHAGRNRRDDRGFTLIELLVVIVIIAILASIAIPVFLGQRRKGYDAAAKSDLRNFASLEETYLTDQGVYGTLADIGTEYKPSDGVVLEVRSGSGTATAFCLYAKHSGSPRGWYYASTNGGLLLTGGTC